MARTNKQEIIRLCNEINKKEGAGSIYSVGSKDSNLKINRWTTGIEDLDEIIGGGMPEGRIIEIYGSEGSGKTSLLYHLLSLHDICIDFPVEGTFDAERARVFGNRSHQLLISQARYGEDVFNKMIRLAREGIPLIGVDSVPSMIPKEDIEKVLKSADKDSIEKQRIGGTARLMNEYLPPLEDIIEKTGTTVIFTNQIRDKINALMFGEKTDTPGGHKLKHAYSIRIQVARKAWIEIPNKNPKNTAEKEVVGFVMKCRVTKSKVCNPRGECELSCFFDRGFVSFKDVQSIRDELKEERAERYGKRKEKDK